MLLELPYGRGSQHAEADAGRVRWELRLPAGSDEVADAVTVARALDAPIGSPGLATQLRGARRVSILVSGKDRVAGARTYVPVLVDRLLDAGIPDHGIEVVCATGTHARHSQQDVRELIGDTVAGRIAFRAHDCDRADGFVDLGATSFGTPVRVDSGVVEADLRILTGRITHHYFAGYSGGRKSVLPGVSARATIVANHRRVLDANSGCQVHEAVYGGNLEGNPVHHDMVEAARKLGPCFVLNTLVDRRQHIVQAFAGELEAAHLAGCRQAERTCFFPVKDPVDVLIASPGGHPCDMNLIQALKAVFNHREALGPGGVFVLVAESAGGILSGMTRWMRWTERSRLGEAVRSSYDLAAHNSVLLRDVLETATVIAVTALPDDEIRGLGMLPASHLGEALQLARFLVGKSPDIGVVYQGNATQSGCRRGTIAVAPEADVERRVS